MGVGVCDRELYEVILQSPLSRVSATELSAADVEKRFPRGMRDEGNHLFLISILRQTETIEYTFACKQRSVRWFIRRACSKLVEAVL